MQVKSARSPFALTLLLAVALPLGCKTTGSATKDLPTEAQVSQMTLAEFVTACENLKASSDPADQDAVVTVLQAYAHTTDCTAAYPILEAAIATNAKS